MAFNRFNPPAKKRSGAGSGINSLIEAEKLMQIAFVMPSCVLVCWGIGWWLGDLLHQRWIETAGVIFGCITAMGYVIRMAIETEKKTIKGSEGADGAGKGTNRREP